MMPSPEALKSLRAEIDALRVEYAAKVGERDAQYIRSVQTVARILKVSGRLLIQFSLDPVSWGSGVLALGAYKMLENMEIGHNVLHGQYNFMNDPVLNSRDYEWDMVATAKTWKRVHNGTHHAFTNVIGRDGDFGYNAFRLSEEVAWNPLHLLQPVISPLSGLFFEYSIGAYDLNVSSLLPRSFRSAAAAPARPGAEAAEGALAFVKKVARKDFAEYVFYPALAGPLALKVLAGNALANGLRNAWAYAVIYCGHLTEDTATFREEDLAGEDKAHWYLRQITGTSNFETGWLGHMLSGHLGYQIEHHLFPGIPAWRYPEMAPRVKEICERHGVPYHSGTLPTRFLSAMRRLFRFALPERRRRRRPLEASAAAAA
jgi:linoleoyl-CoA desaturase